MKSILTMAVVGALALSARGQTATNTFSVSVGQAIPDGDANGLASATTLSGLDSISSVSVSLDIAGGYDGDLYAYLAGPEGQFAVLLNRVGVGTGQPAGFANGGFNITLSDSGSDIHTSGGSFTLGGGVVTGNYEADGRNIDPQSASSAFDSAGTAYLSSFAGTSGNGEWSLFIADLSGGGQSTLVSWGVAVVTVVPEPQTWAMLGGGLVWFCCFRRRTHS